MAGTCVNKSSAEFIALKEQTGIDEVLLAANVSIWQDENGIDKFPTEEELNSFSTEDEILFNQYTSTEDAIQKFYSTKSDNNTLSRKLNLNLSDRSEDSINITERKIEILKQSLNAEVLIDASIPDSGQLLPANHPLSKRYGKPVIVINPNKLFSDTVIHEFGHLYIDLLKEDDGVLNQAYGLLRNTEFYSNIAAEYPELSLVDLDKEVLATAIGIEGDRIFNRDLQDLSNWQKLKNWILNKLSSIFSVQPNAIEKLATELLSNQVRVSGVENYNTIITQRSKYKIDSASSNKQQDVLDLFKKLTKDFTKQTVDNENIYIDKEGNIHNNSVTKNIKQYQRRFNSKDKGDYEMVFDRTLFNVDNIEFQLNQPRVPMALTRALNDFMNERIVSISFTKDVSDKNWYDAYTREIIEDATGEVDEVQQMEANLLSSQTGGAITFKANILKHLDLILNRAEEYQLSANQRPIVGQIIHNALENYINEETPFPSNISDEDNALLNSIKNIIDTGIANGSRFVTEQILYSENKQIPGTADLIEITKSGEAIIYDFKTVNSFSGKDKGNEYEKKPQSLYFDKGYIHQLLSYGAILNQYDINLADDPYHILMAEVKYSNIEDLDSTITIGEVRNTSMSSKELLPLLNSAKTAIFNEFATSSELEHINIKPDIQNLNDLSEKINSVISIYKRRTRNIASNLDTRDIDQIQKDLIKNQDIEADINKYIAKNNEVIINSYVDNLYNSLSILEQQKEYIGEVPTPEFLQSLNYVLQSTEALEDIKKILSENIPFEDKDKLLKTINKTLKIVEENKKYYKQKLQRLSISQLTENSNLMQGLYAEKYQREAKKLGKKTKEEITLYIEQELKKNETIIKVKEIQYWTKQYEDGFADLRFLEYLIADPGMSKSQFVQLTKNILDKADQSTRNKMMDVIPDIANWYNNISYEKTGDPRKVWDRFLEKNAKNDNKPTGAVIPEFTSKFREMFLQYSYQLKALYRELNKLKNAPKTESNQKLIEAKNEQIKVLKKERQKTIKERTRDEDDFRDSYIHPDFDKLNDKEKEDLRFIHKNLTDADNRLYTIPEKKLTQELEDGTIIYNLPKDRMSGIEATYKAGGIIGTFKSKFEDLLRPPADEDSENITNQEYGSESKFGTNELDGYGNEVFSVPVYYRNDLENDELQSYDIPSLLAMNHDTTITYEENKLVEADLFVIAESLSSKNNDKILKTDSFINRKIQNAVGNNFQKSDQNLVYQAVKSSIDNRLYKRAYNGVYSKQNYQLIKGAEAVSKYASTLVLAGNFMSALSTFTQGSIYRLLEASVGEHFTITDWQNGTKKAWLDFPNMLKDSQKYTPESKSALLIKKFGLETQSHALTNKFVQDNFVKKQLDSGTLFSVTSMAEAVVTSNLMYSLLSNVKVTNDKGEYINQEGEKVSKNDAMSLDEAYTVVDGKLELNKFVKYTSFNITSKYNDGQNKDNTIAATEISRYIRSVYADLYGQYNQDMKSVMQRNIAGKLIMSLRGWLPRGVNRRWRGITDAIGKDFMSFDELRDEANIDKRFYSQDQKQFQEGHYTTTIRFIKSLRKLMKQNQEGLSANRKTLRESMTDHEIANLKRTQYEMATMLIMMAMAMLLRTIAMSSEGDDKDKEKIYFAAYLAYRVQTELSTFISPPAMMEMLTNPAASISVVQRVFDWMWQLTGVAYSKEEGWGVNINDVYDKGDKQDESKALLKSYGLVPFYVKTNQMKSILGLESKNPISDSFQYSISK